MCNVQNIHLNDELLRKFRDDCLTQEELLQVLTHIAECDYCADNLAALEEAQNDIAVPMNLKQQILERTQDADVQFAVTANRTMRKTSKKLQLLLYSAQTAAAVILALLMLMAADKVDLQAQAPVQQMEERLEDRNTAYPEEEKDDSRFHKSSSVTSAMRDAGNKAKQYVSDWTNQLLNGGN